MIKRIKGALLLLVFTVLLMLFFAISSHAMTVYIDAEQSTTLSIDIEPSESVSSLRAKIREQALFEDYKLLFNGTALEDSAILSSYGIADGSRITLHISCIFSESVCTACGATCPLKAENNHADAPLTFTQSLTDPTIHEKRYACCGAIIETGSHSGGQATCYALAVCEICGLEWGELGQHIFEQEWIKNDTQHWHKCKNSGDIGDCTAISGAEDHTYKSSCDTSCEVCLSSRRASPHTDSNADYICDGCGLNMLPPNMRPSEDESQAQDTPPDTAPEPPNGDNDENDGLGAGAIIAIILGSVAVLGIAGFLIYWLIIRKRLLSRHDN